MKVHLMAFKPAWAEFVKDHRDNDDQRKAVSKKYYCLSAEVGTHVFDQGSHDGETHFARDDGDDRKCLLLCHRVYLSPCQRSLQALDESDF